MSKEKRAIIDSMTPANRNVLLLLQMRMGHYMDGEVNICKRVNVIRHRGVEYICPVTNPAIDMDMRPLILNPNGDIVLSVIRVQLDQTSEYVGMLDIMVGSVELHEGMRRASVERRRVSTTPLAGSRCIIDFPTYASQPKFAATGMGRINPACMYGETEYNDSNGHGPLQVNPAVLATIEGWADHEARSAGKSMLANKTPLDQSEYFNRKALLSAHVKSTWQHVLACKWLLFKVTVRQRIRSVKRFFSNLFNR